MKLGKLAKYEIFKSQQKKPTVYNLYDLSLHLQQCLKLQETRFSLFNNNISGSPAGIISYISMQSNCDDALEAYKTMQGIQKVLIQLTPHTDFKLIP